MIHLETGFGCNSIVLISAPRNAEEGTPRRLAEDLEHLSISFGNFIFHHKHVASKKEIIELFSSIHAEMKEGFRPILHFDMHGNKENGIEIGATSEFVSWKWLTNELRKLNRTTGNNLAIFITACYGFYILKALDYSKPCPFFIMLAPPDTITVGDIEKSVVPFYSELMQSGSVKSARTKLCGNYEYFHSERVFLIIFARYIREKCMGKGGRSRRERLLTETIKEKGLPNTRLTRRQLRKGIKDFIKPKPELMNRHMTKFLHGKKCSVTFTEVMAAVQKSNA